MEWEFAAVMLRHIGKVVLVFVVGCGVMYVVRRLRRFSASVFGTESLTRGLELQADQLAKTPKSVSSMTRVYLPQIEQDFPEFSFPEFRQKAENMLASAFRAIAGKDISLLVNASESLRDQVRLQIEDLKGRGATAVYERVKLHKTEIAQYEKAGGCCVITLQSALEYLHYTEENGETQGDTQRLTQTKYNVELLYIQDAAKARAARGDHAVGLTCPRCGAPVTGLGDKVCAYCGAGIVAINLHAWVLDSFAEV